jgi:hypothetical protein
MSEKIQIDINGIDKLSPVVKSAVAKSTISLKQMGADISSVGMRMSAAITLPVTLFAKSMVTFGKNASDQLAKLQADMDAAITSKDSAKIEAAGLALDNMTVGAKNAAAAYNTMRDAMIPVNAAIDQAKGELLTGLVPVLVELKPALMNVVSGIQAVTGWFVALPVGTKETVLAFVGLAVAIGPVVVILGQVLTVIGTLQTMLPLVSAGLVKMGAAAWASLGPWSLLAGAILLVVNVITQNWGTIGKALGILAYTATGKMPQWAIDAKDASGPLNVENIQKYADTVGLPKANGGRVLPGISYPVGERGPEMFTPGTAGNIIPNHALGGSTIIQFTYAPAVSLASKAEAENVITPAILSILHKRGIA